MMFRLIAIALIAVVPVASLGCATTPADPEPTVERDEDLPKISDFKPRFHTPSSKPDLPKPTGASVGVMALECRLGHSVEQARDMLSHAGLSDPQQQRWMDNGLVIGTLPAAALSAFIDELPPLLRSGRKRLSGFALPQILLEAPSRQTPAIVELHLSEQRTEKVPSTRGDWRLLLQARRLDNGQNLLQFWPHLYYHTPSLKQRSHAELLLQGDAYRQLSVAASATPGRLFVIMLAPQAGRPAAEPEEPEDPASNALQPDKPAEARPPDLSLLGAALLAGRRVGAQYQRILIIQSQP